MTDLATRFANLDPDAKALAEAALPAEIVRKKVDDYTPDETAAVAAIIDAVAAGLGRAEADMAAAEADAQTVTLDDLPALVDTTGLRRRLTAVGAGPQAAHLNEAWVAAGIGSLLDLMDPDVYRTAEQICATYEGGILPADPRYPALRATLEQIGATARVLPPSVWGRTRHRFDTECGGLNPVPVTEGRVDHARRILADAQVAAASAPPTAADLPPVAEATVAGNPTAPPDGTIDEIKAWVLEADVALRAPVALSHELAKKGRKRLVSWLKDQMESNPPKEVEGSAPAEDVSEPAEAPAPDPSAKPGASGGDSPIPTLTPDAPGGLEELAARVADLLDRWEAELSALRETVKELIR